MPIADGAASPGGRGPIFRGIFPPLVTPFDENGALDLRAFEANLEGYAAFPLGGYLVLGSNGEAGVLGQDEKRELVRATRRRSSGRFVLAGTGLESTAATIAFTRLAADDGADAALVLPPHYYKAQMTDEVLRRHFEAVADASPIPVLLYSVPVYTALPLLPPLVTQLAAHPNVAGIKDSSGDVAVLGRTLAGVPDTFTVACGSAPVLYPALLLGAAAGIIAAACCAPGPLCALYQAAVDGDHARALKLQRAITPLAMAVTSTWGVAGLKTAMGLTGRQGGTVRAPLAAAPPAAAEELKRLLHQAEAGV